jgi:nucleotide-binding universal stress UspA family protein
MRLLIASEGSAHSELAVRLGAQIAAPESVKPTVLTVIKHEEDQAEASATLSRAIALLTPTVSEARTKIRIGHPAAEIVREAVEGRHDLVILGERPTHDLLTRLLGPTVQRVVAQVARPVIIAKERISPLRRILLCDSGAQGPTLLRRFTTRLPELLDSQAEVTVLHVMSQISAGPGVRGTQLRAGAEELIQAHAPEGQLLLRDLQLLEYMSVQAQPKVRHGFVVDEIWTEAQDGDYDLVVIGAHQNGGWQRFLLDDLAHQIVVQADRPVLIIQ